jgi:hypothetical protein
MNWYHLLHTPSVIVFVRGFQRLIEKEGIRVCCKTTLLISFSTKALRRLSESRRHAVRKLGDSAASALQARLAGCAEFGASDEDHLALLRAMGKRDFWRTFWVVAGRTLRKHDREMEPIIQTFIEVANTALSQNPKTRALTKREIQGVIAEAVERSRAEYRGRPDYEQFLDWVMPTIVVPRVEQILVNKAKRVDDAQELARLYLHRRSLQKGIRKGLSKCVDLGADIGNNEEFGADVLEVESAAWLKIAADLPSWTNEGEACIGTRLFAYGEDQAHGWQKTRLRERERRNNVVDLMRRYGLVEHESGHDEQEEVVEIGGM